MEHHDESGQPCTRHPKVSPLRLLELATLGSRMPGFHHDSASKLQSLVMALDEISELAADAGSDLRGAIDTAHTALRELQQLFTANRALAKPPQRVRNSLAEIVARAAERAGVQLRGDLSSYQVRVAVSGSIHAFAMLLDLAAGPSHLGRVVDVKCETGDDGQITIAIAGPKDAAAKAPANIGEVLAIATFLIAREDGELSCDSAGRFIVRLPVAMETGPIRVTPP